MPLTGEPHHPDDDSEPLIIVTDEVLTVRAFRRIVDGWRDDQVVVVLGEGQSVSSTEVPEGFDAAVTASLVTDAIKDVDSEGVIVGTLDRQRLRYVSSPVAARIGALRTALEALQPDDGFDLLSALSTTGIEWKVTVLNQ